MVTRIDGDSRRSNATSIDDTDSPYTTSDENLIYVDTSSGAVTVTLASADALDGQRVRIVDVGENASSNAITINTEGSENINPGSNASITLTVDGTWVGLWSDGNNWFADRAPEVASLTDAAGNTITDFAGAGIGVTSNALVANAGTGITTSSDAINQNIQTVSSATNTSGSGIYLVDTSGGAVTLTLDSDDASASETILVVNVDGSNAVTVETEGSETIDPGAASSKTINEAGWAVRFSADGTNWDSSLTAEYEEVNNDDYHESVSTGDANGTTGLDLSASNFFSLTLTGNTTFTFDNPSSSPAGNSFYLEVTQDGTGGHTITWPGSVEWAGGSAPNLSTSANATHALTFTTHDGGTTWRGTVRGEDFA